jgi:hypothetical protein
MRGQLLDGLTRLWLAALDRLLLARAEEAGK